MRLTKEDKETFIEAVKRDIPLVNYEQQIRDLVMKYFIDILPPKVRAAYDEYPEYFDLNNIDTPTLDPYPANPRQYFRHFSIRVPSRHYVNTEKEHPILWGEMQALADLENAQVAKVCEVISNLRGVINSCTSLKAAKDRLPEFEKYLPAERGVTGADNLPVANVIAGLHELGWPKGVQREAA